MTSILSVEPPSKIPLPKCLVESSRSRTELRDINLAGVVGCKWDQENHRQTSLYSISPEPSSLFTTSTRFIRDHSAATLTPISVNTFSAGAGTSQHDSPGFIGGEMLSLEELPSLIDKHHVESMRLSTSGSILAGDSTFIKISNNAHHSAMNSCEELLRTSSILMELEDAPLGSSDTEGADQRSAKKDLFDASLLAEEDSDLVTFDKTMTSLLFEDDPENLFIVHDCREDHQRFPLHALEEELEDDIQRNIEDEISKEIQHLSQKLANLQARHGAQRMSDGSPGMPSVLSCPVTPVLTPRISRLRKEQQANHYKPEKSGRLVAARVRHEKPALQLSRGAVRKESSERRCSSSSSLNARGQQEEDSPSSGSISSYPTESKKPRARKLQAGAVAASSPHVFPDNNRRFEWVKTLRSGETGHVRHSKEVPTGEELESRASLESVKKKRVALLADMTRELETRLNELAVESAAQPARNPVGRVVASRYNQPRKEKRQPEDYYGSLQKRTAAHLMKAGLTRGPAGKNKSKPEKKAEKKGDKAPEKKSVGIQHDPSCAQPLEQTLETAYEAFVEAPTSDGPIIISEALDVKEEQEKISPRNSSEEQSSAVCTRMVRPRLSKHQPIKRTYIRCIEVVNDPERSARGAIEKLSTSRIISESTEGEGCLFNLSNAGATSTNSNPHFTATSQLSLISLHDKVVGSKSGKPIDQPLRSTVFKLHGTIRQELGDMISGSSDLKAEKPPLSTSLRERWDELVDALEKERLTLPKIRTETGSEVISPRDSGGVKRITEQALMEHFNPENVEDEVKHVIKETRRLRRNQEELNIPQSDLEGFDLESFWCLVRESEDHVPSTATTTTAHPPVAAVR